jgi:hypothetical protein
VLERGRYVTMTKLPSVSGLSRKFVIFDVLQPHRYPRPVTVTVPRLLYNSYITACHLRARLVCAYVNASLPLGFTYIHIRYTSFL